jgi:hypothetical protein
VQVVATPWELDRALASAVEGDRILLETGIYEGSFDVPPGVSG